MILQGDEAREYINRNIRHFRPEELECKCGCGLLIVETRLIDRLDAMRGMLGMPLVLTSFTRCPDHNKAVGGVEGSEHLSGEGADIKVLSSATRHKVLDAAYDEGFSRIGIAKTFIHLGICPDKPAGVTWLY